MSSSSCHHTFHSFPWAALSPLTSTTGVPIFLASFHMERKPHSLNPSTVEFPTQVHRQTFYLMPSATNDTTINQVHPQEEMVRRGVGVAGGSESNYWRNSALSPAGISFKNVSKLPPNYLPDAISNKIDNNQPGGTSR